MPLAYEGTDIISYLRMQIYHTVYRTSYRVSDISLSLATFPLLCYACATIGSIIALHFFKKINKARQE